MVWQVSPQRGKTTRVSRGTRASRPAQSRTGSSNSVERACREWEFCIKPRSNGLQQINRTHQPAQLQARQWRANKSAAAP